MPGDASRGFPACFDQDAWEEELSATTPTGRTVAEAARAEYEQSGIPLAQARRMHEHGDDGTVLPNCAKVYLPPPAGRFGMVFRAAVIDGQPRLVFLAFGVRHHPSGSRRQTVYERAHARLHGRPPRR